MAEEFPDPRTEKYYLQQFEEFRQLLSSGYLSPTALARFAEMKAQRAQILHGNLDDNPEGSSGGAVEPVPVKPSLPALPGANAKTLPDRSEAGPPAA